MPDPRAVQFDHLSFNLPDEDALLGLRDRLKSAGCEVTDVVDHDFIRSIYFTDPNGIALEASWWALDATGPPRRLRRRPAVLRPQPGARRASRSATGARSARSLTPVWPDRTGPRRLPVERSRASRACGQSRSKSRVKGTDVGLNNHSGTVLPLIRTWTVTSDALMLTG